MNISTFAPFFVHPISRNNWFVPQFPHHELLYPPWTESEDECWRFSKSWREFQSYHIRHPEGTRFFGPHVPCTPFVGLSTSTPPKRGVSGFPSYLLRMIVDVLGSIYRPGTAMSSAIQCGNPVWPWSTPFGSSVSPCFHLFPITILMMIQRLLLHDVFPPADWTDQGSVLLHVVPGASHHFVTKIAWPVRVLHSG